MSSSLSLFIFFGAFPDRLLNEAWLPSALQQSELKHLVGACGAPTVALNCGLQALKIKSTK